MVNALSVAAGVGDTWTRYARPIPHMSQHQRQPRFPRISIAIIQLYKTLVNMPPLKRSKVRVIAERATPYPARKPTESTANKGIAPSQDSASPEAIPLPAPRDKSATKNKPAAKNKTVSEKNTVSKEGTTTRARPDLPDSYLDIELEEEIGFFGDVEVPCYENVRRSRAVPRTTDMLRPLRFGAS
jgi:hypothetical protein